MDGAKKNMEAEIADWNFEGVKQAAHNESVSYTHLIAETLTISVSLSQTPPARSSISEARPFSLEWQSCHALSYICLLYTSGMLITANIG